ncbi:MAG TPA: HAMP domain-containing sensor histidine kinase [Vicinamibacterales bacterium]|nr:HAMP domain-containing sensor histidine kinase [Vicinamibacterales bacterium]
MARPLREQFAIATLVLLIPVGAVMTWAAGAAYNDQLVQLSGETQRLASAVAAHIDQDALPVGQRFEDFLRAIPLPEGSIVTVSDGGKEIVRHARKVAGTVDELAHSSAIVSGRGWTVTVGIPTEVAWLRAGPIYRRILYISGIATLIILALEAVFVRRWLPSLLHLEQSADRVGAGDLRTPPRTAMPSRELEHLRDAFTDMVDKLRGAREAIARQVEEERRMREEVELLQQQIIRQERLAAIGVLLSGITHELNNPLQAISGFSEVLQRDKELKAGVRADLALIQKESMRASAIIRNLSRFSRQQGSTPTTVHLSDVIDSVVELRQRRLQELNISLAVEDKAGQPVTAVFTELQQVVLNFVINAEQAVGLRAASDRRIAIRTRDAPAGIRLEVEDSGPGVPPEHESKLFQPFFTTKPIGEGTGLGLSVSYGIIKHSHGTIGYARSDGGGAVFYFELPARTE